MSDTAKEERRWTSEIELLTAQFYTRFLVPIVASVIVVSYLAVSIQIGRKSSP